VCSMPSPCLDTCPSHSASLTCHQGLGVYPSSALSRRSDDPEGGVVLPCPPVATSIIPGRWGSVSIYPGSSEQAAHLVTMFSVTSALRPPTLLHPLCLLFLEDVVQLLTAPGSLQILDQASTRLYQTAPVTPDCPMTPPFPDFRLRAGGPSVGPARLLAPALKAGPQ
jgi:hypothetical protein